MRNILAVAVAVALSSSAAATTLDFNTASIFISNGQTASVGSGYDVTLSGATVDGFVFLTDQNNIVGNGTKTLFLANNGVLTFSQTTPTTAGFDVLSLDVGGSFLSSPERWASLLTFTGAKIGGGTVTASHVLGAQATSMFTFDNLPGFTGLSSFSITPSVGSVVGPNSFEFVVDNLVVAESTGAIPEPASWTMLIAGFGLTGAALRRRRLAMAG